MEKEIKELVGFLTSHNLTIGTAEACTYGLIGASIASANLGCNHKWYKGSIVAPTPRLQMKLLDVSKAALENNGEISSQVAFQMALSGLYALESDVCIGVVGDVNGYGKDKTAPTTAWVCVCMKSEKQTKFGYHKLTLNDTRGENIRKCIVEAVRFTREELENKAKEEEQNMEI